MEVEQAENRPDVTSHITTLGFLLLGNDKPPTCFSLPGGHSQRQSYLTKKMNILY